MQRSSTARFVYGLGAVFHECTIYITFGPRRRVAPHYFESVSDAEVQLLIVKCNNMMVGYIPTLTYDDSEKRFTTDSVLCEDAFQKPFVAERLGLSGERRNSFVVVPFDRKEDSVPWFAKFLLLFRIGFKEAPRVNNAHYCVYGDDTFNKYSRQLTWVLLFKVCY